MGARERARASALEGDPLYCMIPVYLSVCLLCVHSFPTERHEVSCFYSNNTWFPLEGEDFLLVLCSTSLMGEITSSFVLFFLKENPLSSTFSLLRA